MLRLNSCRAFELLGATKAWATTPQAKLEFGPCFQHSQGRSCRVWLQETLEKGSFWNENPPSRKRSCPRL
jgi:hypothetical protein